MSDESEEPYKLTPGEAEYYKIWVFLTELNIKPYELELINPEDQLVLWRFIQYRSEKSRHDSFMRNSHMASKKK